MKKVFVFTKTNWNEPRRMRHDFVELLIKLGFHVLFFEKPGLLAEAKSPVKVRESLQLCAQGELLHHQLRFCRPLTWLNKFYQCHNNNRKYGNPDLIVNFNYDYYWLQNLFGNIPLITVINDDFVGQAKPWMKKEAEQIFGRTVASSDICLAVSFLLLEKCKRYNNNSHIFFPWVDVNDEIEETNKLGDRVVYWGYINQRIDWDIIVSLLEDGIEIDMFGPIANRKVKKIIQGYERNGLRYCGLIDFHELRLESSRYYASILPYRPDSATALSYSAGNRFFKILSLGIPIVVPRLPYLIDAPVEIVYKYSDREECLDGLKVLSKKRPEKDGFVRFLSKHTVGRRKDFLISLLEDIGVA